MKDKFEYFSGSSLEKGFGLVASYSKIALSTVLKSVKMSSKGVIYANLQMSYHILLEIHLSLGF